jgi:hypothetical protein
MGDTTIMGRRVTGSFISCVLYVVADACVSLGQSFSGMERGDWDAMWALQRVGFFLGQIGSTALIVKAYYSTSNRPTVS